MNKIAFNILESTPIGKVNIETLREAASGLGNLHDINSLTTGALRFIYHPGASVTLEQIVALLAAHDGAILSSDQQVKKQAEDDRDNAIASLRSLGESGIRSAEVAQLPSILADMYIILGL